MIEAEQIETNRRLMGQCAALKAVVVLLIDSHPERARLGHAIKTLAEHLTTHYLNTQVSDQFAVEFQTQMAEFQSRAQSS